VSWFSHSDFLLVTKLGASAITEEKQKRQWKNWKEENRGFGIETLGATTRIISNQGYAKFNSRSHDAVIRVYVEAGDVIETHKHAG
jgi:hypothetical protein